MRVSLCLKVAERARPAPGASRLKQPETLRTNPPGVACVSHTSDGASLLPLLRLLDPDQAELLGVVFAEMHEDGRLVAGQVGDARLEHGLLFVPDGPGRPLGLPVHRAV